MQKAEAMAGIHLMKSLVWYLVEDPLAVISSMRQAFVR